MRRRRALVGVLGVVALCVAVAVGVSYLGSTAPAGRTPSGLELVILLAVFVAAAILVAGAVRRRG